MSVGFSASDRQMLAGRLRLGAQQIGERCIAVMYRDPFWTLRFGERGRRYANEDGRRHVDYLAEAVETGRIDPFVIYASWLQNVLTTRGMCSLHILDNFTRLQDALAAESPELGDAAAPVLEAGRAALRPAADAASRVHDAALALRRPGQEYPFIEDPGFLLSYAADAIAGDRDETLAPHVAWCMDAARQLGMVAAAELERTIRTVVDVLAPIDDPAARRAHALFSRNAAGVGRRQ